jgi:hypothetical protein
MAALFFGIQCIIKDSSIAERHRAIWVVYCADIDIYTKWVDKDWEMGGGGSNEGRCLRR